MAERLVVEEGDLKGLSLSLEEGEAWTIGRDPDECQLVIEDPLVSRRHLIAHRTPEGIVVENLSTTNPVQVNDEEIDEPRLLQHGDTLKIGRELIRFYEDSSVHIDEAPENLEDLEDRDTLPPNDIPPMPQAPIAEPSSHTIFDEENPDLATLAEIDFGLVETGRWLLKVVGGPNNGAEFYMETGRNYVIGTDPKNCDIVFHDTSVSRQHARIVVTPDDTLTIEDLNSRNGVLVEGTAIKEAQPLATNTIVTLGTTSFVVYDREGEMQTIISPLLPSIVKVLQQPTKEEAAAAEALKPEPVPTEPLPPPKPVNQWGPYIIFGTLIALFSLAAIGTSLLFKTEPVPMIVQENADQLIQEATAPFPTVHYNFNKGSGAILLLGHVSNSPAKNQLLYNLQKLKFIKSIDDSGIVIDEYVVREVNSILSDNPAWKGISIHSPGAGQFVMSGYLQTHKQADQLASYISLNFPYLDLLKKEVVVEEDIVNEIISWLQDARLPEIVPKMTNSEVTLTGLIPPDGVEEFGGLIERIKHIPGVRVVNNHARLQTPEASLVNISDRYQVSGKSRIGTKYTVVINGRILSEGDDLDGMIITKITPNQVSLEKDGVKYRIDY